MRARRLAFEDVLDEGLAHVARLAEHPDLLADLLVVALEDLVGEALAQRAGLAQHPALLVQGGEARRLLGHEIGREKDLALGREHQSSPALRRASRSARRALLSRAGRLARSSWRAGD